jgi:hypothetical protein
MTDRVEQLDYLINPVMVISGVITLFLGVLTFVSVDEPWQAFHYIGFAAGILSVCWGAYEMVNHHWTGQIGVSE